MFNSSTVGYTITFNGDKFALEQLILGFEGAVVRLIDRELALELRSEILEPAVPALSRSTFERLARWCKTAGIYSDGMVVAQSISKLLFGRIIDRDQLGL